MEGKCLLGVTHECGVVDAYTGEHFPAYEGDHITGEDPVLTLEWDGGHAWVLKSNSVAPGEEVNLPESASKSLLVANGSLDMVCDSASIIKEIRWHLGGSTASQ